MHLLARAIHNCLLQTTQTDVYLVDTRAQVSAVPATSLDKNSGPSGPTLQTANGTPIQTYGSCELHLCFDNRLYQARLIIADVKRPLLGADFFRQHNLLVDLRGQRVIEADTLPPPAQLVKPPLPSWLQLSSSPTNFGNYYKNSHLYYSLLFRQLQSNMESNTPFPPQVLQFTHMPAAPTPRQIGRRQKRIHGDGTDGLHLQI